MKKTRVKELLAVLFSVMMVAVLFGGVKDTAYASAAKSIELNKKIYTVKAGSSFTLKARTKPGNSPVKIIWSSSNKKVASVNQKGKVTARKKGNAVITAKVKSTKIKASCKITVGIPVSKIKVASSIITLYTGKSYQIKAKITPQKATNKKLSYTSGNKKIVTVSSGGKITAKSVGTARVTVKAKDGTGKKAVIKVTVKKKSSAQKAKKMWKDFLDSGKYYAYTSDWTQDSLEYAITDLNKDSVPELLMQAFDGLGFYNTWLFVISKGKIVLADERYGYGSYRYSSKYNAILVSPEFEPFAYAASSPFYRLKGTKLVYLFQVGQDMGKIFYSDSKGKKNISDKKRDSYFADVEYFEWSKL